MFIVEDIIGSIFGGVLIAIVITLVVFMICLLINNKTLQSPIALLVIGGLFIYNAVIGTMIASAYYSQEYADQVCEYIDELTETGKNIAITPADFNVLKDEIVEEYKGAKPLLDLIDANDLIRNIKIGKTIAAYISDKINETIGDYVHNCLMWMFVGTLLGAILAFAVVRKGKGGYVSQGSDMSSYGFDNDTSSAGYY